MVYGGLDSRGRPEVKLISSAMLTALIPAVTAVIIPIGTAVAQDYSATYSASGSFNGREYNSITVNFTHQTVCYNFADGGQYTYHVPDIRMFNAIVSALQAPNNVSEN